MGWNLLVYGNHICLSPQSGEKWSPLIFTHNKYSSVLSTDLKEVFA